jgi:class 3 adenylate cyclase
MIPTPTNSATELAQLQAVIAALEAQRAILGDATVDAALAALRQKISALETPAPSVAPVVAATPAETRRLISILFMDVVGSTTLAENMDAEEWRQIVSRLMETVGAVVVRHHGRVAQYMGDGMLAFFGADQLREDDAENAIRAALAMQAEVARAFDPAMNIRIRVGINSGPVVIGDLGGASHKEFTAIGDAMNTAARVQSEAPVGGVLISQDTYRYVRGVFDVTPRPPVTLKGKSEPVATYLVRRAKPRAFRSATRGVTGIEARTVGRATELRALQDAYLDVFERGQAMWAQVGGVAGVGKTRLMAEFNHWLELREESIRLLRVRAAAGDERQPFALFRWMWFDRFQIADDAPLVQAEAKWVQRFSELWGESGEEVTERAHALGLLAGLTFKDSPHLTGLRDDPVQVKGRAFVVARELIERLRQTQPVVMQLEDLQWADASSCEWLAQLLAPATGPAPARGLLVLGTARPEWSEPAALQALLRLAAPATGTRSAAPVDVGAPRSLRLNLGPLAPEAAHELVGELLQPLGTVPAELREVIVGRAEGMPYYVEELVNWCCDQGIVDRTTEPWRFLPEKLRAAPLPVTLQHLLLTRLSALPAGESAALQRGAVFGRRFWAGGVRALGIETVAVLDALQPRGFVELQPESSFAGDTEWNFSHALLRDVTYETILKRDRATLHRQAAAWLEGQAAAAGRLEEFSDLLAEHCEHAGDVSVAADWHLRAAARAQGRAAAVEARRAFTRALELLPRSDSERRWPALLGREAILEMIGDREARAADLAALLKLAEAPGQATRLAEVYARQSHFQATQGSYAEAIRFADLAVLAARNIGDGTLEIKAGVSRAMAELRSGDAARCAVTTREMLALARAQSDPAALLAALRVAVVATLELDRDYEAGLALLEEQAELSGRMGDRYAQAVAQLNTGVTLISFGQHRPARAALEQSAAVMSRFGARRFLAYAKHNLTSIAFAQGDLPRARAMFEQDLPQIAAVGDSWLHTGALGIYGMVLAAAGDLPGAGRRLAESRALAEKIDAQPLLHDTLAAQAHVALQQARLDEAESLAVRVWAYLQRQGSGGMYFVARNHHFCAEVFDAAGRTAESRAVAEAGLRYVMGTAAKLKNPANRRSYLEEQPDSRALLAWCERMGVALPVHPTS